MITRSFDRFRNFLIVPKIIFFGFYPDARRRFVLLCQDSSGDLFFLPKTEKANVCAAQRPALSFHFFNGIHIIIINFAQRAIFELSVLVRSVPAIFHFFVSPFQNVFLMSRSYHIAPYLSIDILHKNYILNLYKMTISYSVQMQKKL